MLTALYPRSQERRRTSAVEQGVAAEAASRPQDHSFFGGQNRLDISIDLAVAAPLNAKPLDVEH
jgi:hypothetical protein